MSPAEHSSGVLVSARPAAVCPDDLPARDPIHERRSYTRVPAAELSWIREVRLKYGPPVSLVDLSAGGALLRSEIQLRPGTVRVMEIVGHGVDVVPFRVLRCGIAQITPGGVIYQGACEFKRQVSLAGAHAGGGAQALRPDLVLRQLVGRHRDTVAVASSTGDHALRSLPHLLRSMQTAALVNDPLARGLTDLLSELVPALDRGEPATVLRGRVEHHLRRTLPGIAVTVASAPLEPEAGAESIYFGAGREAQASAIVNAQMPDGCVILDWQFRLLRAGSYLLELLSSADTGRRSSSAERTAKMVADAEAVRAAARTAMTSVDGPAESKVTWQKIVARYGDGRLLKGYTHDFHPSRPHFSLWTSIDAAPRERVVIPFSQLKAVFFVHDFDGDPNHAETRAFEATHGAGRRMEVMFADGEVVVGSTLNYRPDGVGFFLTPADPRGNNRRLFVVAGAIRHVRFL